jgi:tetratricopeptide (TPR) repeat protein
MGQKQYGAAIELPDCAIAEHPKAKRLYNVRGMAFMAEARSPGAAEFTRAIQDFDVAIQINPRYAEAHFLRGNCYSEGETRTLTVARLTRRSAWSRIGRHSATRLISRSR